jgi:3',5'-cyclic AMP phosphodiesterase CpdA
MSVRILHLSDLHLGKGKLRDEDLKTTITAAQRRSVVERLGQYLRALPDAPDYVCITGDVTVAGDAGGFTEFRDWIRPLIGDGVLPPPERIILTPGNHDVAWGAPDDERFKDFFGIAKGFTHAYLPGQDPEPNAENAPVDRGPEELVGGIEAETVLGDVNLTASAPYLLDTERELLIFAFNSSLACGVYPDESQALIDQVERALEMAGKGDVSMREHLTKLLHDAKSELMIDAGLVGDPQLQYFETVMCRLQDQLGDRFGRLTKVAMLHHHVSHIWRQQLELKPFEAVIDAAQLKQSLTEFNFDLVLHGHKHTNQVSVDAVVVPTSATESLSPLCIVSGGTVGGYPALNQLQTFKLLTLGAAGSRSAAIVEEFPLVQAAQPKRAMTSHRTVYQAPIANRVPELHDDDSLKKVVDGYLIDEAIKVTAPSNGSRGDSPALHLPGDGQLVDEGARYVFDAMVDGGDRRFYYEVILATGKLDFRQRARIYWMLSRVRALAQNLGAQCQVVLAVGDFTDTHFNREAVEGETRASIDRLKRTFAPAIDSGLLRVFDHAFSQRELAKLDRTIPPAGRFV